LQFNLPLDGVLGARSKVSLLRHLLRTRGEFTGRSLARSVGLDAKTCHTALQDLARHGVIEYRRAGRAHLYRLNGDHVLVRDFLEPLFAAEGRVLEGYARDLRRRVAGRVLSVILFGSVATREEGPASDVDLLFVVPSREEVRPLEEAADRAAVELARRYGNPPQILVTDRDQFRRKAASGDGFVTEILRTGRVIEGKPFSELLKHVS
jgi:predicted nucleotidyltransferase/predicted transcriptional regulator